MHKDWFHRQKISLAVSETVYIRVDYLPLFRQIGALMLMSHSYDSRSEGMNSNSTLVSVVMRLNGVVTLLQKTGRSSKVPMNYRSVRLVLKVQTK